MCFIPIVLANDARMPLMIWSSSGDTDHPQSAHDLENNSSRIHLRPPHLGGTTPVSGLKFICETTLGVIFLYHYSPSISISPVGELYTPLTMEFCICNDEGYISECISAAVVEPK